MEDNPRTIEITRLYLEGKHPDFKITAVLSALQALEKLSADNFDAVVSDYEMPEMNGLELLAELRHRGNKIPFIFLTGKGTEEVAIEALNIGADRYIKKEGNPDVLFNTVAQCIHEVIGERQKFATLMEEKNKKKLRTNERESRGINVNEYLDLIIIDLLVDLLADEGAIRARLKEEELIAELKHKFGINVDSEALHTAVDNLKEEEMITDIGGRIALTAKNTTLVLILKYVLSRFFKTGRTDTL